MRAVWAWIVAEFVAVALFLAWWANASGAIVRLVDAGESWTHPNGTTMRVVTQESVKTVSGPPSTRALDGATFLRFVVSVTDRPDDTWLCEFELVGSGGRAWQKIGPMLMPTQETSTCRPGEISSTLVIYFEVASNDLDDVLGIVPIMGDASSYIHR